MPETIPQQKFILEGMAGKPGLSGSIAVSGAKNAVLPLMAASILCKNPISLTNVPAIKDVESMGELLEALGGTCQLIGNTHYSIDGGSVHTHELPVDVAKKIRASIVLSGPLLARFGNVRMPHPGGDVIGARPIDYFLQGFEKMGATTHFEHNEYTITVDGKLKGAEIFLPFQSVTATETLMMAAVLADGITTIKNAAMEPEVIDLGQFLKKAGAKISGVGTPTITIIGGDLLLPKETHLVIPDRIEAGSFLILGALAGKSLEVTGLVPEHLESLLELFERAQVSFEVKKDSIVISNGDRIGPGHYRSVNLRTHEYPGFPTDLQAPMVVFLTQATGESLVNETIFEGRLAYTEDLVKMGASVKLWNPQQATIKGPTQLIGRELFGPDIRAGLAYVFAGIVAEGESIINNIHHIDRGYASIETRLQKIGVPIKRV